MQGPYFAVHDEVAPAQTVRKGWQLALVLIGGVLVLVAIPIALLPGPGGIFIALPGLILILRNSIWARRQFIKFERQAPVVGGPLRKILKWRMHRILPRCWRVPMERARRRDLHTPRGGEKV